MVIMSFGDLKISRILHAGYVFEHDQIKIAFDPIFESPFSQNCYAYPAVEFDLQQIHGLVFDAVFISHYHDDHFSLESLQHLDRRTPIYFFCIFEEMFQLLTQLGFENVHSLKLGKSVRINSFEVICHPALDVDVDSVFQIKVAGLNILNVVDSWIDDQTFFNLKKQKPWDLVLWPFQLMREIETLAPSRAAPWDGEWPIEWKNQLQKLQPCVVVPSSCQFIFESWSWLNASFFPVSYQRFEDEIKVLLPQTQVMRLDPSQAMTLNLESCQRTEALPWIRLVENQKVDYHYNPEAQRPTTAEIARHFSALTTEQGEQVFEFCQKKLIEKFQSLEVSEELYFRKPLFWELRIYDQHAQLTRFVYQIEGSKIQLLTCSENLVVGWLTEIPLRKLYSALFEGESLTSLYVRINDCIFSEKIECEIQNVDIMNDPLLRCLFDGALASYQKAQLKRIRQRTQ